MFTPGGSFSSFSVDDVAQAKEFYGQTLGLTVADGEMGTLEITMPEGLRRSQPAHGREGRSPGHGAGHRLVQGPGGKRHFGDQRGRDVLTVYIQQTVD